MKLKNIRISNYRCFKEAKIDFDDHITLIVGKNGAGKTAILDVVAVSVSTFLLGIDGGVSRSVLKDDARYEFHDLNGTIDPQHQFPVSIESIGDCLNQQNVKWIRSLNSESGKTTVKDDEADTTGIGYEKIKGTKDEFDLRTVASEVNNIRGNLDGYVFIQVTATPYALYLQI